MLVTERLSVKDIVGVQEKARRAFGIEAHTKIQIWSKDSK